MNIDEIKAFEKELLELKQLYVEAIALAKADEKLSKEQKTDLKKLKTSLEKCRKALNLEKKKLKAKLTKEENDISPILKEKLSELDHLLIKLRILKQPST